MTTIASLSLEEIEGLCERATPGPWGVENRDHRLWVAPIRQHDGVVLNAPRIAEYREGKTGARRGTSPTWLGCSDREKGDAAFIAASRTLVPALVQRIRELEAQINSPVIDDWLNGVRLEAVHQQERWGVDSDAGKTPPDWFWLVGYLAGKALASDIGGNPDKAKHHTISTGAALLNWWRHINGDATRMRPGIDPSRAVLPSPPTKETTDG